MVEMVKYEALPADVRAEADEALAEFLSRHTYANLQEAAHHLGIAPQAVWDRIMGDAAVPQCDMPLSLQVR